MFTSSPKRGYYQGFKKLRTAKILMQTEKEVNAKDEAIDGKFCCPGPK